MDIASCAAHNMTERQGEPMQTCPASIELRGRNQENVVANDTEHQTERDAGQPAVDGWAHIVVQLERRAVLNATAGQRSDAARDRD